MFLIVCLQRQDAHICCCFLFFQKIEDVVHFVYVAKRPGVDEFLTEMAKHYEIVVYTAR